MLKYVKLLIVLAFFVHGNARELDLINALKIAKDNNKSLQIAKSELQLSDALVKEAWSTALPQVGVSLTYDRNLRDNFFYVSVTDSLGQSETSKLDFTFKNQFALSAVLTQPIYSFGKVGNALDAAYYFRNYSNHVFEASRREVLNSVKKSFYQTLLLKKVWEVARESELSAKENYDNINIRYEGGVVSEFDLLQAEVRWQNAIPQTVEAKKNYELAINNLKSLLNLDINEKLELSGDLEKYPPRPQRVEENSVFEKRPDYQALLFDKKIREKNVRIQYAAHLPSIDGSVRYSYSAASDKFKLQNKNDNIILGLSFNIPVFSGGFTSAQVQKARVGVDQAQKRIELSQDQIRINLNTVELRMDESLSKIEASKKNVITARRAFEIAESRVYNGLATQLELKDSRLLLDQAQITYSSAIYEYLDAYFDWELLTGNIDF